MLMLPYRFATMVRERLATAESSRMTIHQCVQQAAGIRVTLRRSVEREQVTFSTAMVLLLHAKVWMEVAGILTAKASAPRAEPIAKKAPADERCPACGHIYSNACNACRESVQREIRTMRERQQEVTHGV